MVYALGAKGGLVCVNAIKGEILWQVDLAKDLGGKAPYWGYSESVLIEGDLVICTPGGDKGTLAALDKKTGKVKWRSTDWTDGAQYASTVPASINKQLQVVQLTQKTLAGISVKDGSVLWKNAWPGRTAVIPTPIINGDQVYICSGYGVGSRKITIGSDNSVKENYSNKIMKNHHGGVLLKDGYLYGYSDGRGWTCQSLETGDVVWDSKKLGKGCVFFADNRLYCMDEGSGTVVLADASIDGWKEYGRFKLEPQTELRKPAGRIWTHPVIANGVLYLRDQDLLFAFNVKK
jgi:outer membrane protein assembly factor BamB